MTLIANNVRCGSQPSDAERWARRRRRTVRLVFLALRNQPMLMSNLAPADVDRDPKDAARSM
jgi:hypothetical protein